MSVKKNLRDQKYVLKMGHKLCNFCHSTFIFKSFAQMKWRYQLSQIIVKASFVIKLQKFCNELCVMKDIPQ